MANSIDKGLLQDYRIVSLIDSNPKQTLWYVQHIGTSTDFTLRKIHNPFKYSIDAQRIYRQVAVLAQLHHANITTLHRVILSKTDLYLLLDFVPATLHSLRYAETKLESLHISHIARQMLKALCYLHGKRLIHRNVKPESILVDENCKVRLTGFKMIRTFASESEGELVLSEEVATKWYRAPELLLGSRSYGQPVDLWSLGCVLAELLIGKPLFAGTSTLHQLELMLEFTGKPSQTDLEAIDSPVAESLIAQVKVKQKPIQQYFPTASEPLLELLRGLLAFNPQRRLTASDALQAVLFLDWPEIQVQTNREVQLVLDDETRYSQQVYRNLIREISEKPPREKSFSKSWGRSFGKCSSKLLSKNKSLSRNSKTKIVKNLSKVDRSKSGEKLRAISKKGKAKENVFRLPRSKQSRELFVGSSPLRENIYKGWLKPSKNEEKRPTVLRKRTRKI